MNLEEDYYLDYMSMKMLILLKQFSSKKNEVEGLKKLYLLLVLLEYPAILKEVVEKKFHLNLPLEDHLNVNVETTAFKEKKYLELDIFHVILARLFSRELVEINQVKYEKQIRITTEGEEVIRRLDEIEWNKIFSLTETIKKTLGDFSQNKIEDICKDFLPRAFVS